MNWENKDTNDWENKEENWTKIEEINGFLCDHFEIQRPKELDVLGLDIDKVQVYIAEKPEKHILIFALLPSSTGEASVELLAENLFSSEVFKPIISKDRETQDWVIWNRQSWSLATKESIRNQLSHVVTLAKCFVQGELSSKDNKSSKENKPFTFNTL